MSLEHPPKTLPTESLKLKEIISSKKTLPYLVQGALVLLQPGYRRYIIVPIIVSIAVFLLSLTGLIYLLQSTHGYTANWLPGWLSWLETVFMGLGIILFIVLYLFFFTAFTNIIAAPFNGFLSEKIQHDITGIGPPPDTFLAMTKRTVLRELQKILYFVGRGIVLTFGLLILSFVPVINLLAPVIGVSWACWVMAIQFIDYPADNNQITFAALRQQCGLQKRKTLTFGGTVLLAQLVPIVNVFTMAAAVAGGTLLWIEQTLRIEHNNTSENLYKAD